MGHHSAAENKPGMESQLGCFQSDFSVVGGGREGAWMPQSLTCTHRQTQMTAGMSASNSHQVCGVLEE